MGVSRGRGRGQGRGQGGHRRRFGMGSNGVWSGSGCWVFSRLMNEGGRFVVSRLLHRQAIDDINGAEKNNHERVIEG